MSEPTRTHAPEPIETTRTRVDETGAGGGSDDVVAPSGYEFIGEIGRGGMGVVYRAHDLDLGREVAVKILLPQYAPTSSTARRFVDEARITGRLQHPGIPAIYRVGTLPDGRPFLAMKLIAGRTLEAMLKERNEPAAEPAPATHFERVANGMFDRLEAILDRGRFLAVFEQIAQAVGYAHQQGVIHRDLKPANVMVGAFGEVQVMDWGIARSGDRKPETESPANGLPGTVDYSPYTDARTPQSDLTQAGSVLGTPAFMPPEQAIGAVDQVGKPSDVFGLGAILCVILTGEPPFASENAETSRLLAARAKLDDAFARLDACGAEPELIALAKRCLAAEAKDRPADAGEVARAIAALRYDAEQRARQAEMDRARAEVKSSEERKRRRIQYALALSVLGLLAITGFAAWWVDGVRSQRRADQMTREAELTARQLETERDVIAALKEVQVFREEGWKLADDPARWALTLTAARSAHARVVAILNEKPTEELRARIAEEPSGVAALQQYSTVTADLRARVAAVGKELDQDDRDRLLLAELDRIADSNEIRMLIPTPLNTVTTRQFAAAFRTHGIDLLTVPTDEAIAWLKGHRFRGRLALAIRYWKLAYPPWDPASIADVRLLEAVAASPAVAGNPAVMAMVHAPDRQFEKLMRKTSPLTRLSAILTAITEDSFTREWWDAAEKQHVGTLGALVKRPEFGRLSSREMSSLADGLISSHGPSQILNEFLTIALERFPGEFWVHLRSAFQLQVGDFETQPEDRIRKQQERVRQHLTAAIAIRPNSAIARTVLGMNLIDKDKDNAAGLRMLHSAAKVDPTSPWPHLFIAMVAMPKGDWPETFRAFKEGVRLDPDTGYFMISSNELYLLTNERRRPRGLNHADIIRYFNELIAIHPKHPGGYYLLGRYYSAAGNHRAALEMFRKVKEFASPDYFGRSIADAQIEVLEEKARWEKRLPLILSGELVPASGAEFAALADYCATFEQKYGLATRFAFDAIQTDPALLDTWRHPVKFAGWAVQAAAGRGADGGTIPLIVRERYRRLALKWVRDAAHRQGKDTGMQLYLYQSHDFTPVRDPEELAKLPAAERAEWEEVWAKVP